MTLHLSMPRYLSNSALNPIYTQIWQKTIKKLPLSANCYTPQETLFEKTFKTLEEPCEQGDLLKVKVFIKWWDSCSNGHNTFHLDVKEERARLRPTSAGGYNAYSLEDYSENAQKLIEEHFPSLRNMFSFKDSLFTPYGPLYFFENTNYWAQQKEFEKAAKACFLSKLNLPTSIFDLPEDQRLEALAEKLPNLISEFKQEIEAIGFSY